MNQNKHHIADVAIIGSGAAGLSLALSLANYCNVTVISKGALTEGSTLYAQGGIAAVFDKKNDSICLLYTSPSPRDISGSRMPSSA